MLDYDTLDIGTLDITPSPKKQIMTDKDKKIMKEADRLTERQADRQVGRLVSRDGGRRAVSLTDPFCC